MKRQSEIVLSHDLKRQGLTITPIARKVGCDRKTVRRHLERGLEPPACTPRAPVARIIALDLSRFDAAPLIAFIAAKEMNYGTETDGRIPF